jgi:Polyketide cyclase / dehydrase and lipid transport
VLSDLSAYDRWNPEITAVSGRAAVGERLTLRVHSRGGATTVHPTVRAADPGRELRWSGEYNDIGGLADSEQRFTIEAAGPGAVPPRR